MSETKDKTTLQASAVAIDGRALVIEGAPGVGKSSLALALIERGAVLIGDDGVTLKRDGEPGDEDARLVAVPPPNIEGLLEVRGVGLLTVPVAEATPVALVLTMLGPDDPDGERLPRWAPKRDILGCRVPSLRFRAGEIAPAERAAVALQMHGLD